VTAPFGHHQRARRPGRAPEGIQPVVTEPGHPVLDAVPHDRPPLLGYNRLAAKSATQVLVRCDADPLLTVGSHGVGRSTAFASDYAPLVPARLHVLARLQPPGQPPALAVRPMTHRAVWTT
jgi:hypothetical protein